RVVVHDSDRLEKCVHDGRAHEAKAAFPQIAGHEVAQASARRDRARARAVDDGYARDERPEVAVEGAELALHGEEGAGVADRRVDLQPVTHDGRVLEQRPAAARIEARHPPRVEAGERTAVARALAEDRRPREPRLGALEREHLEEPPLVVHRAAPLLVVIADVVRVGAGCPGAAALAGAGSGARAQGSGSRSLCLSDTTLPPLRAGAA